MSLRKDAGQLLIAGLSGPALAPLERAWLRLLSPGGVILFRRNVESAEQTHALLSELRALAGEPIFRVVDLEGGLVDRLREALAPMPSPAVVCAAARAGDADLALRHGALIGREARAFGFNTVFAPVLDLATERSAEVMRTRTAGASPEEVTRYGALFLKGLQGERVLGCGKHFPGLGWGAVDSHDATPSIERSWEQMWAADLHPFRELRSALPMVMVAHARYPQATPGAAEAKEQPASISRFWISKALRGRLGFRGLVVSDDMEMGGILQHASIEDAAIAAIEAGTHLIEVCKDPALILRAYDAILSQAERSRSFRRVVQSAARTVRAAKRRLLGRDRLELAPTPDQIRQLREAVRGFAAETQAGAAPQAAVSESAP